MSEAPLSHISSPAERERRYSALRSMMTSNSLDALVISSRGDEFMRGRVQYLSDVFQWAGWSFVVLPIEGEAAFISDPLWGLARVPLVDWIRDIRTTHDPGAEIADILAIHGLSKGAVGIVGWSDITAAAHVDGIKAACPDVRLSDATDLFDDIRAIKSAEEIANLEETSTIIREVFDALEAEIRPGVTERQVLGQAHRLCRELGCLDGIAQMSRTPFRAYTFGTEGVIEPDDVIAIDLEWGGPSGYWAEVRRVYSFRDPTKQEQLFWQSRVESFEACVAAMTPGAESTDILVARDAVYREYGQTAEGLLAYTAHGIGIDSLEPPWVPGKDRTLKENMVINLHPAIRFDDPDEAKALGGIMISDNVLVSNEGPRRLTDQEDRWIVLDLRGTSGS
ncbi:MAG: M24 family metallopeptidase [Acidimicrobiia bacterium]|nr:M24 family metallopeptidase [Acidimicrobiia bacterium]MDH3463078.1 M24 family metallopeptidase [Acidimicrobiia bacterium]